MTKHLNIDDTNILDDSAEVLDRGGIIVYPTDTLYGFGVDARNKDAINKINKIKIEKRPTEAEPSSSDLGARLKKLRQMYKDGILSKVEFEKAKNKLLK